jgi:hypothetical protein
MRAYPRLLPAEQKAWRHTLSWAGRRGMWLGASIAFVTAVILVLVHGFQREDLVPLLVLLCVVVAVYAFRLQQYVRRPSSYYKWESKLIRPPDYLLSQNQPLRCELHYKGTLPGTTHGTCCVVISPDRVESMAMDDREGQIIVHPRAFTHFYPSAQFDTLPPSYPAGPYEVMWFERLGRRRNWQEVVRDQIEIYV